MARPLIEEGDGAPSFRPLWMLMPYLWPKGYPELRARVLLSIVFLVLATGATSVFPLFYGWAVDELAKTPAQIVLGVALSWIAAYIVARILMQAFAQLRDGVGRPELGDHLRERVGDGADLGRRGGRPRRNPVNGGPGGGHEPLRDGARADRRGRCCTQ